MNAVMMSHIKVLWREPIIHFLLIGAVLFLAFDLRQDTNIAAPNHIRIDAGQVEQFVAQFKRTWLRPPTDAELISLIDGYVRNEVYYREALAMGLDQNDPVVRQLMRRKLEFLLEDLTAEKAPDDEALSIFVQRNPDRFREEPHLSFIQVFLNPSKHPDLTSDAGKALARLNNGSSPETEGDLTFEEQTYEKVTPNEIKRVFGDAFSRQLVELEPGGWVGPIFSGYGGHLVKVIAKQEGRIPPLAKIRDKVEREYKAERRRELKDIAYQKLRERYEVTLEPTAHTSSQAIETTDKTVAQPKGS